MISRAAEVLINATNQSMDSWDQSPSATIIEMKLIERLRARVGHPAGDAGVFHQRRHPEQSDGADVGARRLSLSGRHSIQQDGLLGDIRKYKVLCSKTPTSPCRRTWR